MCEIPAVGSAPDAASSSRHRGPRLNWQYAPFFLLGHLIALLTLVPWFFSWTGVILFILGCYVFGTLGLNVGFHRLLTHRSFGCPLWLERTLSVLGACCVQESPAYWVAIHRWHHHLSDTAEDPHSPREAFWWSHVGWLLTKRDDMQPVPLINRYAMDLWHDRFQRWIEANENWAKIVVVSWVAFFALGYGISLLSGGNARDATQLGASVLVWLGALRVIFVWHITWSVNSVCHLWGYRNYETRDLSRNNVIVGFLAAGEGWHNNHHADPNSARHGHAWWEFDLAWLTIQLLEAVGLAWDVKRPSPHVQVRRLSPV
jgi:fatty-acid desaturase